MLGQRVYCKETGENHRGEVVGVVAAWTWLCGRDSRQFTKWNKLYPEWDIGYIIYISLEEPQRSCTYDEFLLGLSNNFDVTTIAEDKLKAMYDKEVKFVSEVAVPMAGVKNITNSTDSLQNALVDVIQERLYQDRKWGGKKFDLNHTENDWLKWINEYANGTGRAEGRAFRERMIKTAALAVAAVETLDLTIGKQEKVDGDN